MSGVTGARRKISSPTASLSAFSTAHAAGADRRLADAARADRRFRIGQVDARPTASFCGASRIVGGLLWWNRLRQRHAVVLVVDPLLADRVADAEHRAAEHLAAEAARVNHGADVGDRQVVEDVILAGLDVDFDFGEAGDEGLRLAVARVVVACATPISPWPASAVADVFVKALMSSGSSWPSYLPPSSIAFCAACASVMLPPPLPETRSLATL